MKWVPSLLILLGLFFCSCQPSSQKKVEGIRLNIVADPATLDPRKARSLNEMILANMLFEGLMKVGKNGTLECALASNIEISPDGKIYTISLKDAYWTNGKKIGPQDFIYAWKTSLDASFPSENASFLFCIKNASNIKKGLAPSSDLGVRQVDEQSFEVELEAPTPYFLKLTSTPVFFPVLEEMDQKNPSWDPSKGALISCGAFSLKTWKHQDLIEVEKNPSYRNASSVKVPFIHMNMLDEMAEIKMFEEGDLDLAWSPLSTLPSDLLESLKKENLLFSEPFLGTSFFRINVERPPFHNVNIRKAFALAIDRKNLVEHVLQGGQSPALRLVPQKDSLKAYFVDHDPRQAKELLEQGLQELGLSREDLPPITFLYASNQRNHLVAQAVQQDWKEALGITVRLEANDPKVYFGRLGRQDYQMANSSWIADFNDPINFLNVFKYKRGSCNNTEWENTTYTHLLDESALIQSEAQREEVLSKCEEILMNEMPIIPIYHLKMLYVKNKNLKNVVLSPLGIVDFTWAEMEQQETIR